MGCRFGPCVLARNAEHGRERVIAERHNGTRMLLTRTRDVDVARQKSIGRIGLVGRGRHSLTSESSGEESAGWRTAQERGAISIEALDAGGRLGLGESNSAAAR